MENTSTNLKGRIPLLVISGLAIVLYLISGIYRIITAHFDYTDFIFFLLAIIWNILRLLPMVQIFLYVTTLHKKDNIARFSAILYFLTGAIYLCGRIIDPDLFTTAPYFCLVIVLFIIAGIWQILVGKKNIPAIIAAVAAVLPYFFAFVFRAYYNAIPCILFYATIILYAALTKPTKIVIKTKQSFKGKSATIILTVAALACVLILCPLECYYLPEFISFFISPFLPVVLFLLFFTKLYQFKKSNIILAVFLLIWAILPHIMCSFLEPYAFHDGNPGYNESVYNYYILRTVSVLPLIIIIIGLLGAFKSKKIYVTLMSIALASCVIPLFLVAAICFSRGFNSYSGSVTLHLLFLSLVDIAILRYLISSKKFYIARKQQKTTPESELKALKEKLEQNLISQEEYDAQRAEIISRL